MSRRQSWQIIQVYIQIYMKDYMYHNTQQPLCILQYFKMNIKAITATPLFLFTSGDAIKEALSVLMLCMPSNRQRPFPYRTKMVEHFHVLSVFS